MADMQTDVEQLETSACSCGTVVQSCCSLNFEVQKHHKLCLSSVQQQPQNTHTIVVVGELLLYCIVCLLDYWCYVVTIY